MRVFGVRIDCMHMIMAVVVPVMMVVAVIMAVVVKVVVMVAHVQTTLAGTERITQRTICDVGPRRAGPLAFHVVVVAFLNRADFGLEPQNFGAILAHHAGRRRHIAKRRVACAFVCCNRRARGRRDLLRRAAFDR